MNLAQIAKRINYFQCTTTLNIQISNISNERSRMPRFQTVFDANFSVSFPIQLTRIQNWNSKSMKCSTRAISREMPISLYWVRFSIVANVLQLPPPLVCIEFDKHIPRRSLSINQIFEANDAHIVTDSRQFDVTSKKKQIHWKRHRKVDI